MKRRAGSWAALLAVLLPVAGPLRSAAVADGRPVQTREEYVLEPDAVEPRELWLLTDSLTVQGRMQQDLLALCQTATVSGQLDRGLWLAGQTIDFDGVVHGGARLAAQDRIRVGGRTGANLIAVAGQAVETAPAMWVGQDAWLVGRQVLLQGRIHGQATIHATRAELSGLIVGGALHFHGDELTVRAGTRIAGNLYYSSPQPPVFDPHNVWVGGQVEYVPPASAGPFGRWTWRVYLFGGALLTGLAFMALFPRYTGRAVRRVRRAPWPSALVGGATLILTPLLALLLVATRVGLPAGLLLAGAYGTLLYLSWIVVALTLGGLLLRREGPQPYRTAAAALFLGLLFLYFLNSLPIVGSISAVAAASIGLGGLILGMRDTAHRAQPPPLPVTEAGRGGEGPGEMNNE